MINVCDHFLHFYIKKGMVAHLPCGKTERDKLGRAEYPRLSSNPLVTDGRSTLLTAPCLWENVEGRKIVIRKMI